MSTKLTKDKPIHISVKIKKSKTCHKHLLKNWTQSGKNEKNKHSDTAIAIYPEIENKSIDEGEISRSRIIDKLCQNQQWEKASSFFFRYSIGKRGDYACAQTIIKELLKDNRPDEAADFLEACTSLSYPSDFNKLKKLIYK